jgi:V/A-type H+-transporting ATPase subunit I
MIVKMQKVTVITLVKDREEALHELQSLGLLHVKPVERPETNTAADAQEQVKAVQRVLRILEEEAPAKGKTRPGNAAPQEMVEVILSLDEQRSRAKDQYAAITAQLDELSVWGEYQPSHIQELADKGIVVSLYKCTPDAMPELPEGYAVHEVYRDKYAVVFAVVGKQKAELELPEIMLPEESPAELRQKKQSLAGTIDELTERIRAFSGSRGILQEYLATTEDDLAHAEAFDQLGQSGPLAYLQGYAPDDVVADIHEAAVTHGWGIVVEEPAADEQVPTLIRNPGWVRPIEAMFNFIDTFPGYHERDVSGVFYLAFSLFYAMLISDAGYGAVILAATISLHVWKGNKIPKKPLYLLYVLNISTIIYGILTGTYFGIELPEAAFVRKFIILNAADMPTMLKFCFTIAVIHLSFAHLWNAFRIMNSLKALSQVGWAMAVWGAYFLVRLLLLKDPYPVPMIYVACTGVALIILFSGFFRNPQLIIPLPNSLISCFSDIISYMRLFAVSFAALKLAEAFNGMAADIGMSNILAGFGAALILVLGHSLNMAMSLLSVLVHGLRLNMLEFSGHLGMEWSGFKYNPLKKHNKEK